MKNLQIVNKLISREHGISEDVVEKVNAFFWKEVKTSLSNLEHTSIYIKHLGTITVSRNKVNQFIKSTIAKIRNIEKSPRYKEETKRFLLDLNRDRLRKALVQRNELAKQYYEAYAQRIEGILPDDSDDIEELGQDSGGNDYAGEERSTHAEGGGTSGDSEEKIDL